MRMILAILLMIPCIAQAQVNAWSLGWRDEKCVTAVNFDEKPQTTGLVQNWARSTDAALLYGSSIKSYSGRGSVMDAATVAGRVTDLYSGVVDKTKAFSISMWVYTSLTGAIDTMFILKPPGSGYYTAQSFQDASNHKIYNASNGIDSITDARCAKLPTGQWVHYVATYDGTYTDVTSWKVYYNNASQSMSNYTSNNNALNPTTASSWGIVHTSGNYLVGYIDNVQFFNKVLTQAEVKYLYEEGLVNK